IFYFEFARKLNSFIFLIDITPEHEIHALAGSSLSMECHLNETYDGPESSTNLYWSLNSVKLGQDRVNVSGDRSIKLQIDRATVNDSGTYICYMNPAGGKRPKSLCL